MRKRIKAMNGRNKFQMVINFLRKARNMSMAASMQTVNMQNKEDTLVWCHSCHYKGEDT